MTGPTHPSLMFMVVATRRAELRADADRYWLTRLVQPEGTLRQHWADLAALAIVIATAVWLATGFAAPNGPAFPARLNVDAGDSSLVTQVDERHLLDPTAAQQIYRARF